MLHSCGWFHIPIPVRKSQEIVGLDDSFVKDQLVIFGFFYCFQLKVLNVANNFMAPFDRVFFLRTA